VPATVPVLLSLTQSRLPTRSLDADIAEYQRLIDAYPALGYDVTILTDVAERAEFVLRTLAG
jgi:predicted ATPase